MAAFGLPFGLYWLTLAPTIYNLDSAELTAAAATAGLMRATGYPLYLIIGHVWSWLPIGDVGYRLNLFSAFNGALTVLLADRILRRLHVGPWAALAAVGLMATAAQFWALSVIAEVYTLHTALMAALILALLRWSDRPSPARLGAAGLLLGLGLSNHLATVLLIPGVVVYLIVVARRKVIAPGMLLPALAGLLLGLSLYLYLPWRYGAMPAFNYAGLYDAAGVFHAIDLRTPSGLWWLITGRSFAGQMLAYPVPEIWRETRAFAAQLWQAFLGVGVGPGLLGLVLLFRRNWRMGALLFAMFAFSAAFFIDYRVIDKDTMFLPTYLIWALWVGLGYQALIDWLARPNNGRAAPLVQVLALVAVLVAVSWNWRLADLSQDQSARERGETILQEVETNALLFGWWDTVPVIEYLQLVEGQRPDVRAINRFLVHEDVMVEWIRREALLRPIYIDAPPDILLDTFELEAVGPLQRLRPSTTP